MGRADGGTGRGRRDQRGEQDQDYQEPEADGWQERVQDKEAAVQHRGAAPPGPHSLGEGLRIDQHAE